MSKDFKQGEQYSTDGPICPYCGYTHPLDDGFFYDESLTAYECESCDKKFSISVYVRTSWTTDTMENKELERQEYEAFKAELVKKQQC